MSLLPGFGITESRDIHFPSVTECLEHVQNICADRLGPVGGNIDTRFFVNSLSLVVLMDVRAE